MTNFANHGTAARAATNKHMIVVLAIVALLAGAFWTYQISTAERAPKVEWTPTEPVPLYCSGCNKATIVEPADFVKIERDKRTSAYQCPACKEFLARVSYGPPGRVAPEGETKP
jgi:hypothetical protein